MEHTLNGAQNNDITDNLLKTFKPGPLFDWK